MTYTLISYWKDWKVDKVLPTVEYMEAHAHKNTFFSTLGYVTGFAMNICHLLWLGFKDLISVV